MHELGSQPPDRRRAAEHGQSTGERLVRLLCGPRVHRTDLPLLNGKVALMSRSPIRWLLLPALAAVLAVTGLRPPSADSACCYFSAKDQDVLQPSQKAFL